MQPVDSKERFSDRVADYVRHRPDSRFAYAQRLDFEALVGRTLCSSYAPRAEQPKQMAMLAALRDLFDATSIDGRISMGCDTRIFVGQLAVRELPAN